MYRAMTNIIVIYHKNCLDGFGAAYAAWVKFGDSAEYIAASYGDEPPDVTDKNVFIVDFSYPRETLIKMREAAAGLVVLDHHKTAKEALEGLPFAIFDMDKSGCVLTWEYLHDEPIPELLQVIQDRDLWQFKFQMTKSINAMMFLEPFDFNRWHEIVSAGIHGLDELAAFGNVVLKAHTQQVDIACKCAHSVTLNEILGLAANAPPNLASDLGHKLALESGTFGLVYSYNGAKDEWLCNLRSNGDFDVSAIAKSYGGGGHKNAAGFIVKGVPGWLR